MNARLYSIIGGDKVEYGPVSEAEIRLWILQGRANSQTSIQIEGQTSWVTLAVLPEFFSALASQAERIAAHRLASSLNSPLSADSFILQAGSLDIGSCFDRSFSLLKRHPFPVISAPALIFFISVALEFVPLVGPPISLIFGLTLWAGLDFFFLKLIRGEPVGFADPFAGFRLAFFQLTVGGVVASVLILIGLSLCILPGIYLMLAWLSFAPLLIMDKQLSFWPAFELSRRVVTAEFWPISSLFIASFAIIVGGFLLVGFGFLIALPIVTGAVVYAYEDIFS